MEKTMDKIVALDVYKRQILRMNISVLPVENRNIFQVRKRNAGCTS